MKRRTFLLLCAVSLALVSCQSPERQFEQWIGTYKMGPVGVPKIRNIGPHTLPAPVTVPGTIRYRLRVSQGGRQVRIAFSNEFNTGPMTIVSASVGLAGDSFDALPGSLRQLTFSGKPMVTLPVGGEARSDPTELEVPALGDLLVSVYAPGGITWIATNRAGKMDPGMAEGSDATLVEKWPTDRHAYARPMISAIEMLTDKPTRVVVAFGDSITDGSVDSNTGDRGWPGALARRVADSGISVVNAGINSNRLLKSGDFFGPAGPARLDRDVFSVPGVTHLIVLEGINDIGMGSPDSWFGESAPVRAEDLVAALREIIAKARQRGIKVIGATIVPFAGAPYYANEKEQTRIAVNHWIRTSGEFDGIVDFDAALRDLEHPERLKKEFDAGDHLHPNAAGCREMARALDLRLLEE
jgi:lysophospholipase L1-like esterase